MEGSAEPEGTHSVLLHEQDRVNCDLLSDHLSGWSYLEIIGCSSKPDEAIRLVEDREPHLVLAHVETPHNGTLRLAQRLRGLDRSPELVVFGLDGDAHTVLEYFEAGARACVMEGEGLEELDATLRDVLGHRLTLAPELGYRVVRRLAELAEICAESGLDVGRLQRLTPREREVLGLLGQRLTNKEIADRLYVEVSTVKSHVHSLLEKLDATGRKEAARYLLLSDEEADEDG